MRQTILKVIIAASALLIAMSASALEKGPRVEGQRVKSGRLEPVYVDAMKDDSGLWGFYNEKGKAKIKPKYEAIGEPSVFEKRSPSSDVTFKYSLIPVKLNGLWGYVNCEGKEVIRPQYDEPGVFQNEKRYGKKCGTTFVRLNGKYIKVNDTGATFPGEVYEEFYNNVDGMTVGRTPENRYRVLDPKEDISYNVEKDKYGLKISCKDNNGDYVYKKYFTASGNTYITSGQSPWWFKNSDDQYVYVDTLGNTDPSKPVFKEIADPSRNDNTGEQVMPARPDSLWGIYTEDGKELLAPKYSKVYKLGFDFIFYTPDEKKALYNVDTNTMVCEDVDDVSVFKGKYKFTKNGKSGIVNLYGKVLLPAEYTSIRNYDDYSDLLIVKNEKGVGLAVVKQNGDIEVVVKPGIFDEFSPVSYRYFIVGKKGNKTGAYCVATGKIIRPVPAAKGILGLTGTKIILFVPANERGTYYVYNYKGTLLDTANIQTPQQLVNKSMQWEKMEEK